MATKKDIKVFLKEVKLTEADIDRMWAEAAPGNKLISSLIKQNIDWRGMNMSVIKSIPHEKENQIKRAERKQARMKIIEEEQKLAAEYKLKQDKIESLNNEDLLIERCLNRNLIEKELKEIVFEDSIATVVETLDGDERRWVKGMETIIQIKDRYFSICWDNGLTECQDDYFHSQPTEVIREEEKVITQTVVNWKVKK